MKSAIVIFSVLLAAWIAGSSYWYVCKIRQNCNGKAVISETVQEAPEIPEVPVEADTMPMTSAAEPVTQLQPPVPYTLLFNTGIANCEIAQADRNHFALIKKYLDEKAGSRVSVIGHADNTGSDALNMTLSRQRAEFIRQQLISGGISAEHISVAHRGESEPVAGNDTEEGRAQNRRVEIVTN
ncbi:MAG: OmpA family protein [Bacteroidales bacterium]|nr:OmpA family protein [Bacteroidales bacterium]